MKFYPKPSIVDDIFDSKIQSDGYHLNRTKDAAMWKIMHFDKCTNKKGSFLPLFCQNVKKKMHFQEFLTLSKTSSGWSNN